MYESKAKRHNHLLKADRQCQSNSQGSWYIKTNSLQMEVKGKELPWAAYLAWAYQAFDKASCTPLQARPNGKRPDSHYPTNRPYWCQEDPEGAGTSGFRPDSPSLPQGQRIGFKTDKIQETTFPKWLSYETS